MDLLSRQLVSDEYVISLRRDLQGASVCRFLVAYISWEGLDSIGKSALANALQAPQSFGVGSLSCSCGYEPLLHLQSLLRAPRLKYFMDPLVRDEEEPFEISLLHSKIVYL